MALRAEAAAASGVRRLRKEGGGRASESARTPGGNGMMLCSFYTLVAIKAVRLCVSLYQAERLLPNDEVVLV